MANTTRTRRPVKGRPAPNKAPQRRRKPVKKRGQPQQVPEVVYTPAPAMSRRKLLLRLLTVVAVVIAMLFAARFCEATGGLFGLQGAAGGWIGGALSKISPFNIDISSEGIEAQIATLALPEFIKAAVLEEITAVTPEVAAGTLLGQYVGGILSGYVVLFLCGLLLFFGVKLVMLILRKLLTGVAESVYLFRKINRLGGMFVGLFKGLVIACGILAIAALIPNDALHAFFNNTMILKGFYNANPIHLILAAFIS